jgi:hypothetical protein
MELSMRWHATRKQFRCFAGWPLLGSTQTDNADVRGTRVLSVVHMYSLVCTIETLHSRNCW